jgi:hypothetical protein
VFHLYPVALRVMLFAVPLLFILAAAGIESLARRLELPLRGSGWLVAGIVMLSVPVLRDLSAATHLRRWMNHEEAFREFEEASTAAEPVYISAGTLPAWIFCTTDWSDPDRVVLDQVARLASAPGPAFENGYPRDTVLSADDARLVYKLHERTVLLGLHTGQQVLAGRGLSARPPDAGWAHTEAARIRAAASPTVWVILMHTRGAEAPLFQELIRLGGRIRHHTSVYDVIVAQYVFDGST